jgi:hypothetical protein
MDESAQRLCLSRDGAIQLRLKRGVYQRGPVFGAKNEVKVKFPIGHVRLWIWYKHQQRGWKLIRHKQKASFIQQN